jgi:cbb3-type cytochrome oxidase cytochrome c subunit
MDHNLKENLFMTIHLGIKRTGPDLLKKGAKYNDNWHFNHFGITKYILGSIMPGYKWLFDINRWMFL